MTGFNVLPLLSSQPSSVPIRRPPSLTPGDSIAVVAPASPPRDLERYRKGLDRLRDLYDVRFAWSPGQERGYLAASDEARAAALNQAISSPSIRAILCVRGGYGSLRLLPRIDWALAEEHPTLLVGYSDVTVLHLAFYAHAGWTGLSAPVVTEWATADDATLDSFKVLAAGETPLLTGSSETPLQTMVHGSATGPLLGGNLSVLTRLVGTPYAPRFDGALLFLEDVAEAPYRIDRMLAHLQHAGVLDEVSGVVLGQFTTGDLDSEKPSLSLHTVFEDYLADRPYPVVSNLNYGHLLPRCTVPIGVPARLTATADGASLELLSPVVAP